ncbi:hypothetical protein KKF84_10755 [Myxococcota bacterium]|nr:hypothetical protein [Myxococcota bacterium]MBU1535791.1 hypothetical protein [Myxococcota bacterium]
MKRGLICYLPTSTTTKKAVKHLALRLNSANFTFHDITSGQIPDLSRVDIVGFLAPMEDEDLPLAFQRFFSTFRPVRAMDAFVMSIGENSDRASLFSFAAAVKRQGFRVVSGHAYTLTAGGQQETPGSPLKRTWFDLFITNLNSFLDVSPNPA